MIPFAVLFSLNWQCVNVHVRVHTKRCAVIQLAYRRLFIVFDMFFFFRSLIFLPSSFFHAQRKVFRSCNSTDNHHTCMHKITSVFLSTLIHRKSYETILMFFSFSIFVHKWLVHHESTVSLTNRQISTVCSCQCVDVTVGRLLLPFYVCSACRRQM